MTKLSDTQAVILSAASQRDDGAVLPLPQTLKIKGGAVAKVLGSLKTKGLIDHLGVPRGDDPPPLRITRAGLEAIGVAEDESDSAPAPITDAPQGAPDAQEAVTAGQDPQAPVERAQAAKAPTAANTARPAAKRKTETTKARSSAKQAKDASEKPTPRAGTKQARMIELLKRPEGATVEQIAAATGWQNHTIRGAISGALKKKLGFKVEATRTREVGPNKTGAKGSSTVYRIVGSGSSR
jgi:hypothetical protein